jgi:hypothetical protein
MKPLAGILLSAFVGAMAAQPSLAQERTAQTALAQISTHHISDFSARKKRRTATVAAAPAQTAAPSHWSGADPTRGPNVDYIRQMQREGRCIIDEGYGRYSSCSNE